MNRLSAAKPSRFALPLIFILLGSLPVAAQQVDERATFWFYRQSQDADQDPTIFKTVASFAERLATLPTGTYFALDVPAGLHRFSWTAAPSRTQVVSIEARAGESIFVETRFRGFSVVASDKAAGILRGLRPVGVHSSFDERVSLRVFPGKPPALRPQLVSTPVPKPAPVAPAPPAPVATPPRSYNAIVRVDLDSFRVETVQQERPTATRDVRAPAPSDPVVLTNNDIVSLVSASLSEELIAARIKASTTRFDTTPPALIALKAAGVSDSLLLLMLEASKGTVAQANDEPGPTPRRLHRLASPPKILYQPALAYPEAAKKENVQGLVVLDVTIHRLGTVAGIRVISSPHPALADAAVKSVSEWRFEPPTPVDDQTDIVSSITLQFKIE